MARDFRPKGASEAWRPRAFYTEESQPNGCLICLRDGIVTGRPKHEAVRGAFAPEGPVRRRRTRPDLLTDPHYLIAELTPIVKALGLVRSLLDWQLNDVDWHARELLDMDRTEMSDQHFRDRQ